MSEKLSMERDKMGIASSQPGQDSADGKPVYEDDLVQPQLHA
jgi:hypothetical protein